jgi:hypothetical protein
MSPCRSRLASGADVSIKSANPPALTGAYQRPMATAQQSTRLNETAQRTTTREINVRDEEAVGSSRHPDLGQSPDPGIGPGSIY